MRGERSNQTKNVLLFYKVFGSVDTVIVVVVVDVAVVLIVVVVVVDVHTEVHTGPPE